MRRAGGVGFAAMFACALPCAMTFTLGCSDGGGVGTAPAPFVDEAGVDAPAVEPRALWAIEGNDTRGAGGRAIHVDDNGDVVTLGDFQGRIDFGGDSMRTSSGSIHPFVVRHAADGTLLWTAAMGSPTWAEGTDLALDDDGNAYVVGRFFGTIDLVTPNVVSVNAQDAFVWKLDRTGKTVWIKHLGLNQDAGWNSAAAFGVAADASGNVVVSGAFKGALDFGGGHVLQGTDSVYDTQGFVAELDGEGRHRWSKKFGTVAYGSSVSVDSSSNVLLSGAFIGAMTLGAHSAKSDGRGDVFVAKIDSSGNSQWIDAFSAPGHADGWDVCVTDDDGVALVGEYDTPMDFGGGPLPARNGGFVARFDASGTFVFSRAFVDPAAGATEGVSVHSVACGKDGSLAVTGVFTGGFACQDGDAPKTVNGGAGVFLATLAADGTTRWSRLYADVTQDNPDGAIALGADGALFVTGKFATSIDFGDGLAPLQYDRDDVFIAKLARAPIDAK